MSYQPHFDRLSPLQQEAVEWHIMELLGAGVYDHLNESQTITAVEETMEHAARSTEWVDQLLVDYQAYLANNLKEAKALPRSSAVILDSALQKWLCERNLLLDPDPELEKCPAYAELTAEKKHALHCAFDHLLAEGGAQGLSNAEIKLSRRRWIEKMAIDPVAVERFADEYREDLTDRMLRKHGESSAPPSLIADSRLLGRLFPDGQTNVRDV